MTYEISEEDKKMIGHMIGDKLKDEFVAGMQKIKDREKIGEARYAATHAKLDLILEKLNNLQK